MPDHYPGTDIGRPPPRHMLTVAAEHAREAVVRYAREHPQVIRIALSGARKGKPATFRVNRAELAKDAAELVTHHLEPWRQVDPLSLTGGAGTFVKAALNAGHEVAAKQAGNAVCVAVRDPSIRLYWVGGNGHGGTSDGHAVLVGYATLRLTMSAKDAAKEDERLRQERAAKRAATKAAKAAL